MQLNLLHLDNALMTQGDFMDTCAAQGARALDMRAEGTRVRLWGGRRDLDVVKARLRSHFANDDGPRLCFMGSGDFHHVSALLIEAAAARADGPVTVVHFDNHPDWVRYKNGMHCGSWVHVALAAPNVTKIITIGVCSNDLENPEFKGANLEPLKDGRLEVYPYAHAPSRVKKSYGRGASFTQESNILKWRTIEEDGIEAFLERVLSRITTKNIYITIDKDVLTRDEAQTNWDQGRLRLPWLLNALHAIAAQHNIIGADVTGDYSPPAYAGTPWRRLAAHVEIIMDQPRARPDVQAAARINSAADHALLKTFAEIMP